jgi:xanthine dehydrogenase accessory factor
VNEWIAELSDLTAAGESVVVVTIAGIRGSAPREAGAKMIVTAAETLGTIGGGQLEFQCTRVACEMLGDDGSPTLRTFPLGASMGQCCGGVVDVLFEPMAAQLPGWLRDLHALHGQRVPAVLCTHIGGRNEKFVATADTLYGLTAEAGIVSQARRCLVDGLEAHRDGDWFLEPAVSSDFNIAVFGAGHVGSAVVRTLAALECNVRWIDSRRNIFRTTPANVRAIESKDPVMEVAAMPAASCYLVMTHSHPLDFEICERILQRRDAIYCGLIGSQSKRRRFEKRLLAQGMLQSVLDSLVCPIGIEGISGKKPAEIAVAAAAEVLRAYEFSTRNAAGAEYSDNVYPMKR